MRPVLACLAAIAPAILLSPACSKRAPADAAPDAAPAAQARPVERPGAPRYPDEGPRLALATGDLAPAEPTEATATARHADGAHTWIAAPLPAALADPAGPEARVRLRVEGPPHGVAARGRLPGADGGDAPALLVRLAAADAPADLVVTWVDAGSPWQADAAPWRRGRLRLTVPADLPDAPALPRAHLLGLADDLAAWGTVRWGQPRPFHAFAAARARALAGQGDGRPADDRPQPPRAAELDELMSLYTGVTSLEEALQADRGLLLRARPTDEATVPLADVPGLTLAEHPWEDMLRKLGRTPAVEPLAAAVPRDVAWLHLRDPRAAARLADDLATWLVPAAQALERRAGTTALLDRYQAQLAVERSALAEAVGHVAADGVALIAGDPFLREGSDVALLFHVRSRPTLAAALATYVERARAAHPDLAEETLTLAGRPVRHLHTPDRRVDRYELDLGAVLALTNSRPLAERLLAVASGAEPALATSPEYRYFRALHPHDPAAEEGYLFLPDAFVARAVSPRTRILQARRMAARADLQAVGFAVLLHGQLEGALPADLDALVASGLLADGERRHPDGTPIAWDPARGASSARWGRLGFLTPLAELPLDTVTPAERDAYARFRDSYQSYWRTYVDPVGAQLRRSADGRTLTVDARVLPLIEQSGYDEVTRMVGHRRVAPPTLPGAVQWTLAIGEDAELRRELDRAGSMLGDKVAAGWVGDWVTVGALGRSGLWDLAILSDELPERPATDEEPAGRRRQEAEQLAAVGHAPVFAAVHVRNPVMLAATLTALRRLAEGAAPGTVEWRDGGTHRDVALVEVGAGPAWRDQPGAGAVALRYATAKDVFLASLDPATLKRCIDAVLDGEMPRPVDGDGGSMAGLRVAPDAAAPYLGRTLAALLDAEVRHGLPGARLDAEALAAGLGALPAGEAYAAAALGYLGYLPGTADGGALTLTPDGLVAHPAYGTGVAPRYPDLPRPGSPLTAAVDALETLEMGLSMDGEAETRGLHVQLLWRRR